MFENCDCFLSTAGGNRFVARLLKHKLQILTGENLILNDQNGAHSTSAARVFNDRTTSRYLP
jgi:hypothetical protein